MEAALLTIYLLQCILTFVIFFKREYGVFQFPFLLVCVNLTFVLPQIIAQLSSIQYTPGFLSTTLITMIICNVCGCLGFYIGEKSKVQRYHIMYGRDVSILVIFFLLVGGVAYYLNRGIYRGGFVEGEYVIINFFTSYVLYSLVLAFIGKKNRVISPFVFRFVLIAVSLIYLDRIILIGRRSDTVRIVLILTYFVTFFSKTKKTYKLIRFIIPLFFLVGLFANTQIRQYRLNAYADVSFRENIKSLDFSGARKHISNYTEGEVFLCAEGINYCADIKGYNYGAFDWNRIVHDFVPSVIVGRSTKEALMIETKTEKYEALLTATGATLTGYYDSFASFGFLGGIKFLLIGLLMGYLWKTKAQSDSSLMMYFCLLVNSLNIITHNTSFFISGLIFILVFVLTFVYPIRRKILV